MADLALVPHCGGGDPERCNEQPVIQLAMPSGRSEPTRWAACPAHLYDLLATVDGDEVRINWLGPKPLRRASRRPKTGPAPRPKGGFIDLEIAEPSGVVGLDIAAGGEPRG